MKRVFVLFNVLIYWLSVVGVSLSIHFCAGKITTFKLLSHESHCACESFAESPDCCQDLNIFIENENEQFTFSRNKGLEQEHKNVALELYSIHFRTDLYQSKPRIVLDLPPMKEFGKLWLFHCSPLHYA